MIGSPMLREHRDTWDAIYGFMEDLFDCAMSAHGIAWSPIGFGTDRPRIFTAAMGCDILGTDPGLSGDDPGDIRNYRDSRSFVFRFGRGLFEDRPFRWGTFRTFLAGVGTVGVRVRRRYSVLTADDVMVCAAQFVQEELMEGIELLGGWGGFQVDCLRRVLHVEAKARRDDIMTHPIPTAPSDMASDPLLSNEYPTAVSNPYPSKYQQSMHTNLDASAVRVLPTHYVPANKLRPVYCFTTEEPA